MTIQNVANTPEPQSQDHVPEPDYNKLTVDNFEMISHDHLIEAQLNFLVSYVVMTIFEDKIYMDERKNELVDKLRTEIQDAPLAGGPPTQRELLDILVKPDTLMDMQLFIKNSFVNAVFETQFRAVITDQIHKLRGYDEDLRGSPPTPC